MDDADPTEDPTIAEFSRVCDQLQGFDAELGAEFVDGCFTALVVAPRTVLPSAWLPVVFGDAFERAFADPDDVQRAMAALFGRWNQIAGELDPKRLGEAPEEIRLRPLMEEGGDVEDDERLPEGTAWATGFLRVVRAFPDDWEMPPRATATERNVYRDALQGIGALARLGTGLAEERPAGRGTTRKPSRDEMIDDACIAVQDVRMVWIELSLRPDPRRVEKTPGRNDACPCGSGKKFKKCCGATAP